MHFMLDENVPAAVAGMLAGRGHAAEFIRDYVPPGAPDPLVATIAQELDAVLVSFDGDFQKIAPRIPPGQRHRFQNLSRIWLRCAEPNAAQRLEWALALIEFEYQLAHATGGGGRMIMWIGSSYLRTDR